MAKNTDITLQNQIIYSVYVRNHTEEGTFKALSADLPRIRQMGCDIIWLMPIHPVGEKGKKGTLGCPYANRDYRSVNPEYGTPDDFKQLVGDIHANGMKCIIDVVYNHTSPDSVLSAEHPEFFYRTEEGKFGNKIGDWSDVIDLDYSNRDLWDYQIESLCMWAEIVDGFRCDVASFIPVEFWLKAREAVERVHPGTIWLAETVHMPFGQAARKEGIYCARDTEVYEAFDIEYEYDIRPVFESYLKGKISLSAYAYLLNMQEGIYPDNYNKLRFLENHDTKRIFHYVKEEAEIINLTAMLHFLKGTTMIYAGQEYVNEHTPSLFEKEPIDRKTGKNLGRLLAMLAEQKKTVLSPEDSFLAVAYDEQDILAAVREDEKRIKVGVFSIRGQSGEISVPLSDGAYTNLLDGEAVLVFGGKLYCKGWPMLLVRDK